MKHKRDKDQALGGFRGRITCTRVASPELPQVKDLPKFAQLVARFNVWFHLSKECGMFPRAQGYVLHRAYAPCDRVARTRP